MTYYKYPRTPHLPWSQGIDEDDVLADIAPFAGQEVIVTEKMDGENTNLYRDRYHARSIDSRDHPSRSLVKAFWGDRKHLIPEGWRICGENVYAKHSIKYESLQSYFYGFAAYDDKNVCLSWDETLMVFEDLKIIAAPQLYRGAFDVADLKQLAATLDLSKQEGYVVRIARSFPFESVMTCAAKFVRKGHVQTDEHWMFQELILNKLAK